MERMSRELKEHIEDTLKEQEVAREHMRSSMLMTEGICNMVKEFIDNIESCVIEAVEEIKDECYNCATSSLEHVQEQIKLLKKGLDI